MLDLQTKPSNNDNTLQKVSALYGYSQSEISENLKDYDIPLKQNSMRTKQLWNWIFLKGIKEFSDIRNKGFKGHYGFEKPEILEIPKII